MGSGGRIRGRLKRTALLVRYRFGQSHNERLFMPSLIGFHADSFVVERESDCVTESRTAAFWQMPYACRHNRKFDQVPMRDRPSAVAARFWANSGRYAILSRH